MSIRQVKNCVPKVTQKIIVGKKRSVDDAWEHVCSNCKGSGLIESVEWIDWWKKNRDSDWQSLVKSGDSPSCPEKVLCDECSGKGTIPTHYGLALVEFLKHHFCCE